MISEERKEAIEHLEKFRELDKKLYQTAPFTSVSHNAIVKALRHWDTAIQALREEPDPCDFQVRRKEMKDTSDVLTVSFDSGLKDESALCVSRKYKGKTIMLKIELGEQADILYRLLTEQMTKAEIKEERREECQISDQN